EDVHVSPALVRAAEEDSRRDLARVPQRARGRQATEPSLPRRAAARVRVLGVPSERREGCRRCCAVHPGIGGVPRGGYLERARRSARGPGAAEQSETNEGEGRPMMRTDVHMLLWPYASAALFAGGGGWLIHRGEWGPFILVALSLFCMLVT